MSTIVTMTQTVGDLTNANTYRVKSRYAEGLVAANQATKSALRGAIANISVSKEGKH